MNKASESKLHKELDDRCESVILDFERLRLNGPVSMASIGEMLNEVPLNHRGSLLSELARIDLERSFDESGDMELSPFIVAFPDIFASPERREEVGYEHYRLSRMNGHNRTRVEIGNRYQVDGDQWLELPKGNGRDSVGDAAKRCNTEGFPRPGESFCGYPILAELGHGALARVYLARQPDLAERLVVLKVTERLTTESDKLASLQHSNIVPVFSIHQEGSLYCICMPFLGVLTLSDLLQSRTLFVNRTTSFAQLISTVVAKRVSTIVMHDDVAKPDKPKQEPDLSSMSKRSFEDSTWGNQHSMDPYCLLGCEELAESLDATAHTKNDIETALSLVAGLTEGMAYAHSRGIVHRDLKPDNLLIANDGRPVILDFNLAFHSVDPDSALVGGTIPYMSPQQIRSLETGANAVPSDDVFSIGVIFYQLLSGRLPYEESCSTSSADWEEIATRRQVAPLPAKSWNASVSPGLESIVQKCLAGNPNDRYPSAIELLEDLNRFRENRPLRYARDPSAVERTTKFLRRHPILSSATSITLVATAIVALIGAAWLWNLASVEKLKSKALIHELRTQLPEVLSKLHSPQRDPEMLRSGMEQAQSLLKHWDIGTDGVMPRSQSRSLSGEDRRQAMEDLGYLLYAVAGAEANIGLLEAGDRNKHMEVALRWNETAMKMDSKLIEALQTQKRNLKNLLDPSNVVPAEGQHEGPASKADSVDSESLRSRLLIAREKGEFVECQRIAEEIASQHPTDPTSWFNLGSANYSIGDHARAAFSFDVAAKLQPKSSTAIFWRGLCRMHLGQWNEAIQDFTYCIQSEPNWEAARYNRALTRQLTGDFSKGIEDLDYLIEMEKGGPRVWILRSRLQQAVGKNDLARADQQKGLEASPKNADDWVALGLLKLGLLKPPSSTDEAIDSFDRALVIDPYHVAALQNSAHVQGEVLQKPAVGIEFMNRLAKLRPQDPSLFASRGILEARVGHCQLAKRDAILASQMKPTALEQLQIAGIYALLMTRSSSGTKTSGVTQSIEIANKIDCPDSVEELTQMGVTWLARSLTTDPKLAMIAESDPDLENLRNLPRFKQLIAGAKSLISPN